MLLAQFWRPPFGGWRHHLARWEACHWILRHRAGYLSEGAFMGRLGANVSGLAYSYAEYAPYGSLRIQFPCHPLFRGHYGCWAFRSIYACENNGGKTKQPGFARKGGCLVFPAHQYTSILAHYRGFIKTGAEGALHNPLNSFP